MNPIAARIEALVAAGREAAPFRVVTEEGNDLRFQSRESAEEFAARYRRLKCLTATVEAR